MIDSERLAVIRTIPERFNKAYVDAKTMGCSEMLALGLACDKVGLEAVEAVQILLDALDRREDDLK